MNVDRERERPRPISPARKQGARRKQEDTGYPRCVCHRVSDTSGSLSVSSQSRRFFCCAVRSANLHCQFSISRTMRLHRAPSRTYLPVKAPTTRGISATRRAASRNNGTSHPPAQLTRRDLALSLSLFSFSFSSSLSFSPTLPAHAWSFSFFPAQQAKLMDAEFANTLINAMTAVAGTTRTGEFQLRCAELRTAQLPVYESAGSGRTRVRFGTRGSLTLRRTCAARPSCR